MSGQLPNLDRSGAAIELGLQDRPEIVVPEQIKSDSERLDGRSMVVGPFARLDANRVAAQEGKTRGAITNLFGSQANFQAETMARALSAGDLIDQIDYPEPGDFRDADAWVDAFIAAESARGPMHGSEPTVSYAYLWALWLSVVPYGLWSKQISRPGMGRVRAVAGAVGAGAGACTGPFRPDPPSGHDHQRSCLRGCGHDRRRLAQPVPEQSSPF